MASVSSILPPEHIFVGASWQSKKRAFEQVSIVFENASSAPRDRIFSALIQRERLGSTCIGGDGAIPHGRLDDIDRPLCALALLQKPIPYGLGDEGGSARSLFFLIAPSDEDEAHLQFLGLFAEMLSDETLMGALHASGSAEAAAALIAEWEAARGGANPGAGGRSG